MIKLRDIFDDKVELPKTYKGINLYKSDWTHSALRSITCSIVGAEILDFTIIQTEYGFRAWCYKTSYYTNPVISTNFYSPDTLLEEVLETFIRCFTKISQAINDIH
jgi:hypothetical protein